MIGKSSYVLIGLMGVGKTSIGRALAARLQLPFVDTDEELQRSAGKTISQIFADEGEESFRKRESALLVHLVDANMKPDGTTPFSIPKSLVLSTGGGIPMREENATLLRSLGTVVWLRASAIRIAMRIGRNPSTRPLLRGSKVDVTDRITKLMDQRDPVYAATADVEWDTEQYVTPADAAAALYEHLCLLK